jgi:hypothetical protein
MCKHEELNFTTNSLPILLQITTGIDQVVLAFPALLFECLLGMEFFIPRKKSRAPKRARF